MPIRHNLIENRLTSGPDDYYAQVDTLTTLDFEAIADRMLERGSTVTRADILAVLTEFISTVEQALVEGNRVNVGDLVYLFPSIGGVFNGATDSYDPARHSLNLNATAGAGIRKAFKEQATTEKVATVKPSPDVLEYVDAGSETANSTLTPSNIGTLNGSRLKFDPEQADEGIYFIADSDGAATKVTTVSSNKPSSLSFLVPTLAAGGYRVEVRARMTPDGELRTGSLNATLSVS